MAAPGSTFGFPFANGTYEAGTAPDHSDDKLVSNATGTVLFCKSGHGFSVLIKNPTVTIDGENSRLTADVGVNQNGTWYGFQRADIAELDLSGVEPEVSDGGNTLAWEDIPAKLSADGAAATGLYPAGELLDSITVETSLQRPLLTECTIDAGVGTPPAVDFTKAALPTLSNPVTGSGGTINWGFRRALRNTVTLPTPGGGSFQLLGGASEGYPGNMGGSASPAPGGGLGKFFRFPIASYSYEEGAPGDPGDDRLIATSNATVGFCNPNARRLRGHPLEADPGGRRRQLAPDRQRLQLRLPRQRLDRRPGRPRRPRHLCGRRRPRAEQRALGRSPGRQHPAQLRHPGRRRPQNGSALARQPDDSPAPPAAASTRSRRRSSCRPRPIPTRRSARCPSSKARPGSATSRVRSPGWPPPPPSTPAPRRA